MSVPEGTAGGSWLRRLASWEVAYPRALTFVAYLILLGATLSPALHLGFYHDTLGYVAPNTGEFAKHLAYPFLDGNDSGHPMLYAMPVAALWRLFGTRPEFANVIMWLYGALALTGMHALAQAVVRQSRGGAAPRWVGPAAALCLFSTPLFIAYVAQYHDSMPALACFLWMMTAWMEQRRGRLALWAILLCLTRLTGWIPVLGLGLFEITWVWGFRRQRGWRASLVLLAPYTAAAAALATYLFIKLVVFRLPLCTAPFLAAGRWSDYGAHFSWFARAIVGQILSMPPYSFKLMLLLAGAGLAVAWWRRWQQPIPAEPSTPPGRPAWAFYVAALCALTPLSLFYAIHTYFPQPRFCLPEHAVIILAGIHGGLTLLPRRRAPLIAFLAAWCMLQGLRWHADWLERCVPSAALRSRLAISTQFNLDVIHRERLYRAVADYLVASSSAPSVLTCTFDGMAYGTPVSGYVRSPLYTEHLFGRGVEHIDSFVARRSGTSDLFIVQHSWDDYTADPAAAEMLVAAIARHPEFKLKFERSAPNHDFVRVYGRRLSGAPAAREVH